MTLVAGPLLYLLPVVVDVLRVDVDHIGIVKFQGLMIRIAVDYVIRRDGSIETGRPLAMVGAHCLNHNKHSIGICYEGGLDIHGRPADTRTEAQKVAMRQLLEQMHARFPRAIITGHNVFNPMKTCPCFNASTEYQDLQP